MFPSWRYYKWYFHSLNLYGFEVRSKFIRSEFSQIIESGSIPVPIARKLAANQLNIEKNVQFFFFKSQTVKLFDWSFDFFFFVNTPFVSLLMKPSLYTVETPMYLNGVRGSFYYFGSPSLTPGLINHKVRARGDRRDLGCKARQDARVSSVNWLSVNLVGASTCVCLREY